MGIYFATGFLMDFLPAGLPFGRSHTYTPWEFELLHLKLPFTTGISIPPSDALVGKPDWPPPASPSLRAAHHTRLRQAGWDVWAGAIPVAISTCDEILMGRTAPIYSCQLDGRLDGMDGDAVGKFWTSTSTYINLRPQHRHWPCTFTFIELGNLLLYSPLHLIPSSPLRQWKHCLWSQSHKVQRLWWPFGERQCKHHWELWYYYLLQVSTSMYIRVSRMSEILTAVSSTITTFTALQRTFNRMAITLKVHHGARPRVHGMARRLQRYQLLRFKR